MKHQTLNRTTISVVLFYLALSAYIPTISGAEYCWSAASGLLPDQVDSPIMQLSLNADPETPVLTNSTLLISTDERHEWMWYSCSGTNLDIPTNLVIEAQLRYVSGASVASGRSEPNIGFVVAPNVGGILFIDRDNIFLGHDVYDSGTNAAVDTDDAFHTYRIEVDTSTPSGMITVSYDGVPVLTDHLLTSGNNVTPTPMIHFGDGTTWAYGQSLWKSFCHNAAREIIRPPVVTIRVSQVEICWNSYSNQMYKVQYRSDLTSNTWVNLFTNVAGTGTENCVLDAVVRGQAQRYYRVEVVQ